MIKHILCSLLLFAAAALSATGAGFTDETLHYVVGYKWGIIHKAAGEATLTLRNSGDQYRIVLTARSKPWADKIFRVRDTLTATVARNGFLPKSYTKAAHEDGKYTLDKLTYSRHGNVTMAEATRLREKNGAFSTSRRSFSASGPAFDMLSIFYYIRQLNFSAMKPGETVKTTIFSGSQSEQLTIRYTGRETITLHNKQKRQAYCVTFSFTTAGKKKSSDDMQAWIATDAAQTVLRITGKLPVGHVRVDLE